MTPSFLEKLHNLHVLVTGGAGFIGANLCEFLLKHHVQVGCLDNLSTGHLKNIQSCLDHPNFRFIEGDIRDIGVCKDAVHLSLIHI